MRPGRSGQEPDDPVPVPARRPPARAARPQVRSQVRGEQADPTRATRAAMLRKPPSRDRAWATLRWRGAATPARGVRSPRASTRRRGTATARPRWRSRLGSPSVLRGRERLPPAGRVQAPLTSPGCHPTTRRAAPRVPVQRPALLRTAELSPTRPGVAQVQPVPPAAAPRTPPRRAAPPATSAT